MSEVVYTVEMRHHIYTVDLQPKEVRVMRHAKDGSEPVVVAAFGTVAGATRHVDGLVVKSVHPSV